MKFAIHPSWAPLFAEKRGKLPDGMEVCERIATLGDPVPMAVVLPWPTRALSPNARTHWAQLAKAKAAYRQACYLMAKQALAPIDPEARPLIKLLFVPPSRRRHDLDNCLASMKSGLDGVAQVLGCDDSRWRLQLEMASQVGGFVRLEVAL